MANHDFIISTANKSSIAVSGGLLGYLAANEEKISILLAICTFIFTATSLICSIYFQIQRNKREEIVFEERRKGQKDDTGERRREGD